MSQTDKPMHKGIQVIEIITGFMWHEVVLLSQKEGDQVDVKIKKHGGLDFAARTILKAMLSALDNMLNSQVQDKAKHLGSWYK